LNALVFESYRSQKIMVNLFIMVLITVVAVAPNQQPTMCVAHFVLGSR